MEQRCEKGSKKNVVAVNDAVLKKLLARERNRSLEKKYDFTKMLTYRNTNKLHFKV